MENNIPARPVDALFSGRREAISEARCMPAPIGCGGPAVEFQDEVSEREYGISGLCQSCQNEFFNPMPDGGGE